MVRAQNLPKSTKILGRKCIFTANHFFFLISQNLKHKISPKIDKITLSQPAKLTAVGFCGSPFWGLRPPRQLLQRGMGKGLNKLLLITSTLNFLHLMFQQFQLSSLQEGLMLTEYSPDQRSVQQFYENARSKKAFSTYPIRMVFLPD